MNEIYFIRHGQASFGEENYDRLSDLGVKQAKHLARHLAKICGGQCHAKGHRPCAAGQRRTKIKI